MDHGGVAAVLLLARYGDGRAALRGRVSNLPANEVITPATYRTVAAPRATSTPMATRNHGFRYGTTGRTQRKRRSFGCRRPIDENGAFRTMSHNHHSQRNRAPVHLDRRSPIRDTSSNHWRSRSEVHVEILAGHVGSVRHAPAVFIGVSSLTDGQTERTNQTIEQLIRTNCPDRKKWEDVLPMLEFSYNNAPSATTNHSPFYLNYGMDPTVPVSTNVESQRSGNDNVWMDCFMGSPRS
ncbi:hypothetical protein CLOM_g11268 [Closterium sp. NIES-68]|nr:hypothetical protein CLOM_g11268 [Closterium sp. NIES-68]